jgi:isoquinoline 1-oxidoreductase
VLPAHHRRRLNGREAGGFEMSGRLEFEAGFEPERYELDETPGRHFLLGRRDLFKLLGGGIVVLFLVEGVSAQERGRRRGGGGNTPREVGAWLHIGEEGQVTVYTGKTEVGQNIRTSLAQVVAEELPVPLASIRLVMADTELTPYDAGTFGSRTTPGMAPQLRRAAAAAREALLDLAAEEMKVDRASLTAADGAVLHKGTGEKRPFGQLTKGQKIATAVSEDSPIRPAGEWTVAGRSAAKVNGREFVTGRHKYASDVKLPGMLYGRVLRPPAFGATLVAADTRAAEAMSGVVVARQGDAVGVAAPTEHQAARAIAAVKPRWKSEPHSSHDTLFDVLKQTGRNEQGGRGGYTAGSMEEGLQAAEVRLAQTYTIAYIAHAPLEPRAAVAQWEGEKLTVWTGTQRPFGVRSELSRSLNIPEERVRVIVPDTGSGYGGKHTGEAAIEAAWLARAAGKPVKLVWTREEEFTWAYFRPAGVIEVKSGARKDGTLTAWEFHNYNSGGSGIRTLYDVPHQRIEFHPSRSPLRQGSYRALASTANTFARECHMDEIAHAVGMDPLAFRLKNLKDARLRAVFEAAAKAFGWGGRPEPGRGFGLAGGFEKGSYVATCAEVAVERGERVKVLRAVSAFECGAVLNPEHLMNQVEGSMVMGIGGALFEAIRFADGKILNPRFSGYRVPRFSDTPKIEVVLLDRKDLPSAGAGETPIIGIAPAIGNAIFAATGTRLRSLPLVPDGAIGPSVGRRAAG